MSLSDIESRKLQSGGWKEKEDKVNDETKKIPRMKRRHASLPHLSCWF